jgi:beta-glucosidase
MADRPAEPPRHPRPLDGWITEIGISDDATTPRHQRLKDDARVAYLAGHLEALAEAISDGADVRRYFVWSLLDSFEWELGYGAPFGLVQVDVATQKRTLKRSAHWYRDFIAQVRSARPG